MASFKYYVHADFVFIDAPFPASGPPQQVVTQFYPGLPYFEWQPKPYFEWQFQMPDEGLNWLLSYLADKENGSFDGILGFSQVYAFKALTFPEIILPAFYAKIIHKTTLCFICM